jgi:hypothetical protein
MALNKSQLKAVEHEQKENSRPFNRLYHSTRFNFDFILASDGTTCTPEHTASHASNLFHITFGRMVPRSKQQHLSIRICTRQ